jgi:MFS family permease
MPILFLTVAIDLIGFGIMLPLMPFMAPKFGASTLDIALILATYSIFAGLCGPFWGKMSDKFGRKTIILICLSGTAIGHLMLAASTELWMIYGARAFTGLVAGNIGVASAMAADMSTPENRAKSMGILASAFGVGLVLGPVLGGILAGENANHIPPALSAAALSITAALAGFIFLKETLTPEKRAEHDKLHGDGPRQSLFSMVKTSGNLKLVSLYFIHNMSLTFSGYLFPLWVGAFLAWGPVQVGYVFGAQGILVTIIQLTAIGPLVKRMGEIQALLLGIGIITSGYLATVIASGALGIVGGFFLIILGSTVCTPMLNALISQRTPPHYRGQMMGTTSSLSAYGRMGGPLLGGAILSTAGFAVSWASGILIGVVYSIWPINELRKGVKVETKEA